MKNTEIVTISKFVDNVLKMRQSQKRKSYDVELIERVVDNSIEEAIYAVSALINIKRNNEIA